MRQVILIMTDTQRKDMLGCYGNTAMKTPALDALAGAGVRFERAYCCQPVPRPDRRRRTAADTTVMPRLQPNRRLLPSRPDTLGRRVK